MDNLIRRFRLERYNVAIEHLLAELDPFLIGRCLYVGGLYAEQMPLELRSKFLECTINCLRNRQACARLCAAKAATFWLRAFSAEADTDQNDNILGTQLPVLFQELFNLGNQLISVEALTIVMENLAALTSVSNCEQSRIDDTASDARRLLNVLFFRL